MSEQNKTQQRPDHDANHDPNRDAGDVIGELIRHAGSRPTAPPAMRAAVEGAAREAWQDSWQIRRRKRGMAAITGIAAALAIAVVSTVLLRNPAPAVPAAVATIDQIAGQAGQLLVNGQAAARGSEVQIGDVIETGAQTRAGLRLIGRAGEAISLRMDSASQIRLVDADQLRLNHGRVYADTGDDNNQRQQLTVITPLGEATDIGTQFAVSYLAGRMIVGVREGLVEIGSEFNVYQTKAQRQSTLLPGGQVSEQELASNDPQWDWLYDVAPQFADSDQKVLAYLRWVARETGRELVFADPSVEQIAAGEELSGAVAKLSPHSGLDLALASVALRYEQRGDTIVVSRR